MQPAVHAFSMLNSPDLDGEERLRPYQESAGNRIEPRLITIDQRTDQTFHFVNLFGRIIIEGSPGGLFKQRGMKFLPLQQSHSLTQYADFQTYRRNRFARAEKPRPIDDPQRSLYQQESANPRRKAAPECDTSYACEQKSG